MEEDWDSDSNGLTQKLVECSICGKNKSARHARRHLNQYLENLNFQQGNDGDGEDIGLGHGGGDGQAPEGNDNVVGDVEMDVGDMMDVDTGEDLAGNFLPPTPPAAEPGLRGEVYHNPPVTVEDESDLESEPGYEDDDEPIDDEHTEDGERDPEYVERDDPLEFDAEDEPMFADEEVEAWMEANLGDFADEELAELHSRDPSPRDETILRFLATRLRTHFSRRTYNDLRNGVCEPLDIPSEFIAWRRLRNLSELSSRPYSCCVNSCCCFLGKYKDLNSCPYCKEPRYGRGNKPRRYFRYTPLIPQLEALFRDPDMIEKLAYRQQAEDIREPDTFHDVFDSERYHTLRNTQVHPDKPYRFFQNPQDIALGLSTDGFTLFKRRRRGHSTAWPIMLIIYNLHPRIRTRLENVICVGVIPGPKQCKDLNSFLIPLLDELLKLEEGVEVYKVPPRHNANAPDIKMTIHAFIILIFGDIPAVSKLLGLKGHNAELPCRACYFLAVLCQLAKNQVNYVPLTLPGESEPFPLDTLPMRAHALFFEHYAELEAAPNKTQRKAIAQSCGVNSRPIFASLKSIDLATCAPYDIMHLFFENLVPNLIKHWTGKFKGIGPGTGNYNLSKETWKKIGLLTTRATRTIPSAFVGTLPDIAEDGKLYKAEAHSFWIQHIAPIVLKDRLPEKYYKHVLLTREIIILCLDCSIKTAQIDELEELSKKWVLDYEELYYQYKHDRLPTCPLTIHVMLHLAYYLRLTGPLWATWSFVMERLCGHFLPAVKNRVRPYDHLDNYVERRAQMQAVSHKFYKVPIAAQPTIKYTVQYGERISSREKIYPDFPVMILGAPVKKSVPVNESFWRQLTKYFGTTYSRYKWTSPQLRSRIDTSTLVRYGRVRLAGDGDRIRTAELIDRDPASRDNSFVRYDQLPDRNVNRRRADDDPYRRTQYGRLLDIYYVEFIPNLQTNIRKPYLLARIQECKTGGLDASKPANPVVTYTEMEPPVLLHAYTIDHVIGRIRMEDGSWAIIDRSRNGMRTQFVDAEDD